ncbi:hypothetical protein BKA66DRAFT_455823 [Pyrenochaeta sp. MPI-SDFR-AT-0127]|nr:hypothetical protein BKA66DRAFT_455823 [Pyrenochaeta sp. MPI-SDFR-AT-0127]
MLDEFFRAAFGASASIQGSTLVSNRQKKALATRHGTNLFQFYKQGPQQGGRLRARWLESPDLSAILKFSRRASLGIKSAVAKSSMSAVEVAT